MFSLLGALSTAMSGLRAQQGAIQTAANNIANTNTPGYARRRVVLQEQVAYGGSFAAMGNGVQLTSVRSLRDSVLELRLHEETQSYGESEAYVSMMQKAEVLFGDADGALGNELGAFFDAMQNLSTDASSVPLREGVLTAAGNLASAFRTTSQQLVALQGNISRAVKQAVEEVNELAPQIAALNAAIHEARSESDASALEDQRTLLIRKMAELTSVSVMESNEGVTLTTANGVPLVLGSHSYALEAVPGANGSTHVSAAGEDITSELTEGKLGGLLRARDVTIPGLLTDLDELAYGFATTVNSIHHGGFDLSGNAGGDFFAQPEQVSGAAGSMTVALSNARQFAASMDGSTGGSANLARLLAVRDTAVVDGKSPVACYSAIAFRIGSELKHEEAEVAASEMVLQQLQTQRDAISGVSMDEELADLLRFQRAFQAAARVVTVVDELTEVVMNMRRS